MRSRPAACFQSPHRGMQAELISSPRRVKCTLRWCPGGREGALKEAIAMCARRPRGPGGREGALKEAIVICVRRPRCPGGREGALKAGKAALAGCVFALWGCEPVFASPISLAKQMRVCFRGCESVFAFAYFSRKTDAASLSRDVNSYSSLPIPLAKRAARSLSRDGIRIRLRLFLAKQLRLRSRGM